MNKKLLSVVLVGAGALVWIERSSGQDVRPTPGLGTGIITVNGTVEVANTPSVRAAQEGEWKVALTNRPTVSIAVPDFLTAGHRYRVTWPSGSTEVILIIQPGPGSWANIENTTAGGRRRWVNLSGAQSVEELQR